ncbi:hypothetical protein [Leucobacter massiliensis]|uniref:Uncharacterized protein n=1 Tax=Leucobacter massiliensis TaxID=1686285 RepID=A0A2S9QKR8_9MICO|nr:hypothetical protein [Leucobacter massiliensis]PRI10184.1 hypothetical protein B4915_12265 [Leucobacter massiliensis]
MSGERERETGGSAAEPGAGTPQRDGTPARDDEDRTRAVAASGEADRTEADRTEQDVTVLRSPAPAPEGEDTVVRPRRQLHRSDDDAEATVIRSAPAARDRAARRAGWAAPAGPARPEASGAAARVAGRPPADPAPPLSDHGQGAASRVDPRLRGGPARVYGPRARSVAASGADEVLRRVGPPPSAGGRTARERPPLPALRRRFRRERVVTLTCYAVALAISAAGLVVVARIAFG